MPCSAFMMARFDRPQRPCFLSNHGQIQSVQPAKVHYIFAAKERASLSKSTTVVEADEDLLHEDETVC